MTSPFATYIDVLLIFPSISLRSVRVDTDVGSGHFSTVRLAISIIRHGILPSGRGHDQGGVAAQPHRSQEDQFRHVRATVFTQEIRLGWRKRRYGHFVLGLRLFKVSVILLRDSQHI